jgi:LCP family protein required for cell wall assembly
MVALALSFGLVLAFGVLWSPGTEDTAAGTGGATPTAPSTPPSPAEPPPEDLPPAEPPPAEPPPAAAAKPAVPAPRRGLLRRRPSRRSRGQKIARFLSWVAVLTSASILLTTVLGVGMFTVINSHIDRQCLFCGDEEAEARRPKKQEVAGGKALNFLLVGSDSREGMTEEELRQAGTEANPGGVLTDTIILVHLSPKRDKAVLVSFPRDTWVDIPGHGDGKINTAYGRGERAEKGTGPRTLIQTVEGLTGIYIDHYLEVRFGGFLKMVDALGGVDVCLPTAVQDKDSALDLPAGKSRVKGKQALAFVRARKFDPRGDFGRIQRQQQFLGAMLRRATSAGILARPDRLYRFLDTVARNLTVDDKLGINDMRNLASKLRGLDPAKIVFVTVPYQPKGVWHRGQLAVELDRPAAQSLFDAIKNDDAISAGASPAPSKPPSDLFVRPERVTLRVLNGNGLDQAAGKAAADLREVGFQIAGTGSADSFGYERTIVRHGPSKADSARTTAAAIPGAMLQLDQTLGSVVEVVIGKNYSGARPVTVGPPPSSAVASPRPTATPSPIKTITAADEPEGC